jgi:hypothetical protein
MLLYPEPTETLESGVASREGERGLRRAENAEGGGARVSV